MFARGLCLGFANCLWFLGVAQLACTDAPPQIEVCAVSVRPVVFEAQLCGANPTEPDFFLMAQTASELDSLEDITWIRGSLRIENTSDLIQPEALSALRCVEGTLAISNNQALQHLDQLSNLQAVGANLFIDDNPKLINLNGLANLHLLGGDLILGDMRGEGNRLLGNPSLSDIRGLAGLQEIGGALWIEYNDTLRSLEGLHNVVRVGYMLGIFGNAVLGNLDGLRSLTEVGGPLIIDSNPSLSTCAAQALRSGVNPLCGSCCIQRNRADECAEEKEECWYYCVDETNC